MLFLENEAQTNEKFNTEQWFSLNVKATCKNSGTFNGKKFQANFPLSIVFHQALQLQNFTSVIAETELQSW